MPYAFSRTISDVLCTFKRFHNFIFHQSARWVYLGPGVKVGSLFLSARKGVGGLHGGGVSLPGIGSRGTSWGWRVNTGDRE